VCVFFFCFSTFWWIKLIISFRECCRNFQPVECVISNIVKWLQSEFKFYLWARIDKIAHSLRLSAFADSWFGKIRLVQVCKMWTFPSPKGIWQRPRVTRWIETWLSDSMVSYSSVFDHRNRYIRSQSAIFTHIRVVGSSRCCGSPYASSLPLPAHFWWVFAVPARGGRSPRPRDDDLVGGGPTDKWPWPLTPTRSRDAERVARQEMTSSTGTCPAKSKKIWPQVQRDKTCMIGYYELNDARNCTLLQAIYFTHHLLVVE